MFVYLIQSFDKGTCSTDYSVICFKNRINAEKYCDEHNKMYKYMYYWFKTIYFNDEDS
jgi:hypothetical protein